MTSPGKPYHPPKELIEAVPRSTPYDVTVGQRVGNRLEQVIGEDGEPRFTGFLLPPDASQNPARSSSPQRTIEQPNWWNLPGRAARYLRVLNFAGKTVLSETLAGFQASGSTKDYKRTSMPGTHKMVEEVVDIPRNPTALSSDGAYFEMFFAPAKHSEPKPQAPITWAQRRAVSRLEQARRDAAISGGEAAALKASRDAMRDVESKGLPMSRYERHIERARRRHTRRMHRYMRKAGRIADGRNMTGRIARIAAFFDSTPEN